MGPSTYLIPQSFLKPEVLIDDADLNGFLDRSQSHGAFADLGYPPQSPPTPTSASHLPPATFATPIHQLLPPIPTAASSVAAPAYSAVPAQGNVLSSEGTASSNIMDLPPQTTSESEAGPSHITAANTTGVSSTSSMTDVTATPVYSEDVEPHDQPADDKGMTSSISK
ncbi:hypothetical protein CONPUDRAFT_157354 [Coniophora puteana RWD-64-598 SS2]|uniref:Uncharacterized protein n=1 Tax=Coniophora puteana (strain RWD-64-598) TaxID=741705 RepID=A0A5M3MDH4_CONPW|nr:uncharacterized protein CONPUDRAFT_157354 [Coniophora puteana RWD-64-598 SS2]EIW77087.1 hypothetical protein CONPUDRAFT_157354 [Coniophora puteana RWD-64-598 SS2]